jgi:alpha-mannosidase
VRLYEAAHTATHTVLTTALKVRAAAETDMLESRPRGLDVKAGKIALEFRPFEVKTIRLKV